MAAVLVACGGSAESPATSNALAEVPNARALAVVPPAGPAAAVGLQVGGTYALRKAGTVGEFVQAVGSASPAALAPLTLAGGATIPLAAQFVVMPQPLGPPPKAGCFTIRTKVVVDLPFTQTAPAVTPFTTSLPRDRYMTEDSRGQVIMQTPGLGGLFSVASVCSVPVANGYMLSIGATGQVLQRVGNVLKTALPDGSAAFAATATWDIIEVTRPGSALAPTVSIRSIVPGLSVTEGDFSAPIIDAQDADGAVLKVELFNGFNRVTSGLFFQPYAPVFRLPVGQYRWYARAFDQSGAATTSAPVDFEVKPRPAPAGYQAPTAMLNPAGTTFNAAAGQLLGLRAEYASGASTVQRVEFMEGNTVLAASTQLPVTWAWAGPVGDHNVTVRLTDVYGNKTTSAQRQVVFSPLPASDNQPPSVRLVNPPDGGSAAEGLLNRMVAEVSDPERQVAHVEFYDGTELLGASSQAPYNVPWMGRTGVHTLTARAVDAAGQQATSAAVTFTVTAGAPSALGAAPDDFAARVEPTAPRAGGTSVEFAPLTLSANLLSATGGTVARVEFYVLDLDAVALGNPGNLRFIGSTSFAPYKVVWARPTRGRFALVPRAVSTLGRGSSATTGAVFYGTAGNVSLSPDAMASFTVGPEPRTGVAMVTSPPSGTALELGNGLVVKANAVGLDGTRDTVARVLFLVNGRVVDIQENTLVRAPFAIRWLPSALGSYVLDAVATDSVSGRNYPSKPVTVNVIAKGATPPAGTTNRAPRLALTSPSKGLKLAAGTVLRVSAEAQDLDGQVVNVWFRNSIGDVQVKTAPYAFDWKATGSTASVWAEAEDNQGTITITPTATVTVQAANQPPVVKLLTPAAATSISAGSAFTLVADASDADGSVATVDFFDNGRLMGTATRAPWRLSGVASYVGPHIISARVTDNAGASTTSPGVLVQVTAPAVAAAGPLAR